MSLCLLSAFLIGLSLLTESYGSNSSNSDARNTPNYLGTKASPINLITAQTVPNTSLPPLNFTLAVKEKVTVSNTGFTLAVTLKQKKTKTVITGGVLGDKVYRFAFFNFFINNDYTQSAGVLTDGRGSSLVQNIIFYNAKCGSFEKAVNKTDGVVVIINPITVQGLIDNPNFTEFENLLYKVQKTGQSVNSTLGSTFSWSDILPRVRYYYAYNGSVVNLATQQVFYDATIIVLQNRITSWISVVQYNAFRFATNFGKELLTTVTSGFPQNDRHVIQAQYVYESRIG